MNSKSVSVSVRRSGADAFDVCVKTGDIDVRGAIALALDKLLETDKTFVLFPWSINIVDEPYPGQNFQKEFIHIGTRTFCGEAKNALKILNTWVNGVEKSVGKNNLSVEFAR